MNFQSLFHRGFPLIKVDHEVFKRTFLRTMRWLAPQPLRTAKMFPATHQTAPLPVFTAKAPICQMLVLQPTGIQPNLYTKAAMRLRQQIGNGWLRISDSRRATKTCPGLIIHQTLQMLATYLFHCSTKILCCLS